MDCFYLYHYSKATFFIAIAGIAEGEINIIFMGNDEFRHYVTVGRAVNDVNRAEKFCESGFVVVSPTTWMLCPQHEAILSETMSDNEHVRVRARILYYKFLHYWQEK